jgi:hypothetical protein
MSFVVVAPAADPAEPPIESGAFWPAIDPVRLRASQRIDSSITTERLRAALIEAIASVNGELDAWRLAQVAAGHATLVAVPAEEIDDISLLQHRYERAVGCIAKADVTEHMRDFDTTNEGHRQADALNPAVDDLRRDARWAISAILGIPRSTVELI